MQKNKTTREVTEAEAKEKVNVKLGMDVHAKQITVCEQEGGSLPKPGQVLSWERLMAKARKLVESGAQIWSCYEAGPFGYGLHRDLEKIGVKNIVVAPQRWDERGERVKTDLRDARELVDRLDRYLRGNTKVFSVVRVPTAEQEQRRSVVRQRGTLLKERNRCILRGRSQLLLNGVKTAKGWWQAKAWEKVRAALPPMLREQVELWQKQAQAFDAQAQEWEEKAREGSAGRAWPKGFGTLTAAQIESEILDWHRFKNRRQVASYTGLCPSEHSSGGQRRQGAINKHGNPRVRHCLLEAVWRLEMWQPDYRPLRMLRQAKGKRARKQAAVAVARHLSIDLWRLMTGQSTPEKLGLLMVEGTSK